MDGFAGLLKNVIVRAGVSNENIFEGVRVELPGFFRPTKEWDIVVVERGQLLVAIEMKSQVGPSFGNNFNNRTEEALGSAVDLWTAFRKGTIRAAVRPWLGYLFMLEDCPQSRRSVSVNEPHFKVLPEFVDASYARRYEVLCRHLVTEGHYTASSLLLSDPISGRSGEFREPTEDLGVARFVQSLMGYVAGHTGKIERI
jgi:hypothetical protein